MKTIFVTKEQYTAIVDISLSGSYLNRLAMLPNDFWGYDLTAGEQAGILAFISGNTTDYDIKPKTKWWVLEHKTSQGQYKYFSLKNLAPSYTDNKIKALTGSHNEMMKWLTPYWRLVELEE